jgi:DNA repair ATPase RecN
MEKDEDYEIIPHKEIIELKKEIDHLKRNPLGRGKSAEHLLDSINDLSNNISNLIKVFKEATNILKEDKSNKQVDNNINSKIEVLFDQNKEIAEALVSLADMIKEEKKDLGSMQNNISSFSKLPEFLSNNSERPQSPQNFMQRPQRPNIPPPGNPNPMPSFGSGMNMPPPPPPGMDLPPPPNDLSKKSNNNFPF